MIVQKMLIYPELPWIQTDANKRDSPEILTAEKFKSTSTSNSFRPVSSKVKIYSQISFLLTITMEKNCNCQQNNLLRKSNF